MTIKWTTQRRRLGQLKAYEHNPRTLSKKEHDDLRRSIDKFDLAELPAVNLDNTIVAGHQRITILKEKYGPQHEIEVRVPNRKLTEKEFDEYLVRSNKNTGSWDFDILANSFEVDELIDWGFRPDELVWDVEEKVAPLQDEIKDETKVEIRECPHCQERFETNHARIIE